MHATFSNDESNEESEYDQENCGVAFITHIKESSNYELYDDLSYEAQC